MPGVGTTVLVNGKPQGEPIKEPEFFTALMRIWLGTPPMRTEGRPARQERRRSARPVRQLIRAGAQPAGDTASLRWRPAPRDTNVIEAQPPREAPAAPAA